MAKLDQKELIIALREGGQPFQKIAEMTGCSSDFARTVCSRADRMRKKSPKLDGICKYCGRKLDGTKVTKPRQFCDDKCSDAYFNAKKGRKLYVLECEYCKREFVSCGVPKRRFCSRDCQKQAAQRKCYGEEAV